MPIFDDDDLFETNADAILDNLPAEPLWVDPHTRANLTTEELDECIDAEMWLMTKHDDSGIFASFSG